MRFEGWVSAMGLALVLGACASEDGRPPAFDDDGISPHPAIDSGFQDADSGGVELDGGDDADAGEADAEAGTNPELDAGVDADAEPFACTLEIGNDACGDCIGSYPQCLEPCRACEENPACVAIVAAIQADCMITGEVDRDCAAAQIGGHPSGASDFNRLILGECRALCGGYCPY